MRFINRQDKKWLHYIFEVGMILKAVNSLLEIVGGSILLFLNKPSIVRAIISFTAGELSEDPSDRIARLLLSTTERLSTGDQLFASTYLLTHGLIKIGLVTALFKRQLWAYPLAIGVFGLFVVYQLHHYTQNHSTWLIVLSVVDAIVMVATWFEYKRIQEASPAIKK